jgi:hypothetical protein
MPLMLQNVKDTHAPAARRRFKVHITITHINQVNQVSKGYTH